MDLLESTLLTQLGDLLVGTGLDTSSLSLKLLGLAGLLSLGNSLLSRSLSLSWLLVSLLLDELQRSTLDRSLVLDGLLSSSLLGLLSDTLLVLSSVQDSPRDLSWVLSLLEQRRRLGRLESENFRVTSDEQGTSTWVDLSTGEGVNFDLHCVIWLTKKVNGKCVRRRKFSQIEEPGDGAGSRGWNSLHGARFSKRS